MQFRRHCFANMSNNNNNNNNNNKNNIVNNDYLKNQVNALKTQRKCFETNSDNYKEWRVWFACTFQLAKQLQKQGQMA
jgi:hypothetical protein